VSLWLSASILFITIGAAISGGWPVSGQSKTQAGFVTHLIVEFFEWFGELAMFCWRMVRRAITPPYEIRELVRQLDAIGAKSLPLVALAGAATGIVLSLELSDSLTRFGAKSMLPEVIVFSIIKESGPVITGLVVSGRVGAGIGAELGSMKVSEQVDAMEASAVDPYRYLVATRVLACILMMPLLTLAADFCGILMGWVATTLAHPVSPAYFLTSGFQEVAFNDFIPPVVKTSVFGFIIGIISCFQGMNTKGGTEGVGRSTTSSVVLSSLFVILADVVLVRLILMFFP
jgi:phospholipid/cholesterol/gamma-HCH transport system permease protein